MHVIDLDQEQSLSAKLSAQIEAQHQAHRTLLTAEKHRADSLLLGRYVSFACSRNQWLMPVCHGGTLVVYV